VDVETDKPGWSLRRARETASISRQYGIKKHATDGVEGRDDGKRCVLSVIQFKSGVGSGKHPTEKSVEMYKWLIERYCPAEGTILDPTAGSFNSCLAGMSLGRNCIGIEKDEGFFKKAVEKFRAIGEPDASSQSP